MTRTEIGATVLAVFAAAASFFFQQPASLYGPDGMPKIPGLSR